MFYGDRVRETTTTTGTGTITLAGAVAQYQTFTSRVLTGDQCEYVILDANGTAWEVGQGTMATTSTLSRDTVYESSNADALVALSAGTHTVFLTYSAQGANKRLVYGDAFIDYIASGLVLPSTSGTLAGTLSAGIAYVIGQRVVKGAQANTYTASKDTYVDLSNTGVLTYSAVNNGAGAPALTANSIRLGYVVTGGSTITSKVQAAKDSLGNWMGNTIRQATCTLAFTGGSQAVSSGAGAIVTFSAAANEVIDNVGMHSTSVNNTRITALTAGTYNVSGLITTSSFTPTALYMSVLQNGSAIGGGAVAMVAAAAQQGGVACCPVYANANDYFELSIFENGGSITLPSASLNVQKTS